MWPDPPPPAETRLCAPLCVLRTFSATVPWGCTCCALQLASLLGFHFSEWFLKLLFASNSILPPRNSFILSVFKDHELTVDPSYQVSLTFPWIPCCHIVSTHTILPHCVYGYHVATLTTPSCCKHNIFLHSWMCKGCPVFADILGWDTRVTFNFLSWASVRSVRMMQTSYTLSLHSSLQ